MSSYRSIYVVVYMRPIVFIFIFIMINLIILYFLEYVQLFLDDNIWII